MFALIKPKNGYEQTAEDMYAKCLGQARNPAFYADFGVPDSFDGRFDLLTLHVFMIVERLADSATGFNQALFDMMFRNMDQTLREMGIGDVGVPKHMKRMMLAFNGRMHAYEQDLRLALGRNLYGGVQPGEDSLKAIENYVLANRDMLRECADDAVMMGQFEFKDIKA